MDVGVHQLGANGGRNDEYSCIFFGGDDCFKRELVNHARGCRNAKFVRVRTVKRDFATFIRDKAHADASAQNEDNPEASGTVAADNLVFIKVLDHRALRN